MVNSCLLNDPIWLTTKYLFNDITLAGWTSFDSKLKLLSIEGITFPNDCQLFMPIPILTDGTNRIFLLFFNTVLKFVLQAWMVNFRSRYFKSFRQLQVLLFSLNDGPKKFNFVSLCHNEINYILTDYYQGGIYCRCFFCCFNLRFQGRYRYAILPSNLAVTKRSKHIRLVTLSFSFSE